MGAFKTFLGFCLLVAAWIFVGILNVYLLETQSSSSALAATIILIWLFSGPLWTVLYFRWRGKRFSIAFEKMREALVRKTRAKIKRRSAKDEV